MSNDERKRFTRRNNGDTQAAKVDEGSVAWTNALAIDSRSTEARVQAIMELMIRGEYAGARTVAALSDAWRITARSVDLAASEASRAIRRTVDRDAMSGIIMATFLDVMNGTEARARVSAAAELAKLLGLITKQVEHSVKPASSMTEEEARATLAAALEKASKVLGETPQK